MIQDRLFRLAVESVNVNANHVAGEGWSVTITSRRQGEQWDESGASTYSSLSTAELLDVIDAELSTRL